MEDYNREASAAAKKIQRLLQQNRAHTYINRQTRGKLLDLRNVSGLMTRASNVYRRQLINDEAEYELCMVLDLSGSVYCSMSGANPFNPTEELNGVTNTLFNAWLLAKVFTPVLGKKSVGIYGFNRDWLPLTEILLQHRFTNTNHTKILYEMAEVVRQWTDTSPVVKDENGTLKAIGGSRAGGNHDGYYLLKSVEDFKWTVSEPNHRIIVHFSDGQPLCHGRCGMPGCGQDGFLRRDLHNSVKKLRESGYLCIGVGLGYDGVSEYYDKLSIVANSPSEMYSKTIDILKQQIKRGKWS